MSSQEVSPGKRHYSRPLRLAMIGTGSISRLHLPAFQDRPDAVRLSAICEINPEAASRFAAQIPYPVPIFADHREILKNGETDAVLVALPHHLHYQIAAEVAGAGIPVLVEKLLTCSLKEARGLRSLSSKTGVPILAAQMLRFLPEAMWLKQWILQDPENFGPLRTFDIQSWQNILAYVNSTVGPTHWLLDGKAAGGGVVVSLAIHQLDLIRFITGQDFVEATAWGRFDPPFRNEAESCALALLKMSNGACGVLHATYTGPRVPYSEALTMFGENGTIIQHSERIGQYRGVFRYTTALGKETRDWNDQYEGFERVPRFSDRQVSDNPFVNQLVELADALAENRIPANTVSENFNTLACIEAIYTSLRTAKPCQVAKD
jgi:UDP-N-acetyl-2-amino-2-deoxyglucuronate dehydrogenase